MDPALQLILDTMNKWSDELDTGFANRDCEFTARTVAVNSRLNELATTHVVSTIVIEECLARLTAI